MEVPADLANEWEKEFLERLKAAVSDPLGESYTIEDVSLIGSFPGTHVIVLARKSSGRRYLWWSRLWGDAIDASGTRRSNSPANVAWGMNLQLFEGFDGNDFVLTDGIDGDAGYAISRP